MRETTSSDDSGKPTAGKTANTQRGQTPNAEIHKKVQQNSKSEHKSEQTNNQMYGIRLKRKEPRAKSLKPRA